MKYIITLLGYVFTVLLVYVLLYGAGARGYVLIAPIFMYVVLSMIYVGKLIKQHI